MYDSKYMVLWKRQIDGDIKIFSIFQGIGSRKGAFQEAQWEWHQRRGFHLWVRKMPWSRKWQPTSVFIPGKFYGQKSLVGYSPWAYKELGTTEWLNTHTHTHTHTHTVNIRAQRIFRIVKLFLYVVKVNTCHHMLSKPIELQEGNLNYRLWMIVMFLCKVAVAQLCPTLCDTMDYTVYGILHARILE